MVDTSHRLFDQETLFELDMGVTYARRRWNVDPLEQLIVATVLMCSSLVTQYTSFSTSTRSP